MLSKIISVVLGIFFLIAGIGKVLDVSHFALTLYYFGITQYIALTAVSVIIPAIEIILGLSLILFVKNKLAASFSILFLLLFTGAFVYAHFAKHINDCGCFGVISSLESPPWLSMLRNLIFISMAVFLYLKPVPDPVLRFAWMRSLLLYIIGAAAFALAGISVDEPLYEQEPFLNKKIQQTLLNSFVHTNPDSTYLIFLMSTTCSHCWNATENVKAYKTFHKVSNVFALATGTDSTLAVYKSHFNPNFNVQLVSDSMMGILTGGYIPKLFLIRKDSIAKIESKEISSPWSEELQ
ncbi:MAG TPA: MauE/DoxX family redox-associated membrane protein [Chitinophagaceae bacterium]|nr:MauE/DoxX family redox-associated membrane protein [Chitinophagaceae bacterium]